MKETLDHNLEMNQGPLKNTYIWASAPSAFAP